MKKSKLYGTVGSTIFMVVLLILLLFIFLPGTKTPEDEGIMVSFGDAIEGSGATQEPAPQTTKATPPPPPPVASKPVKQDLMTQNDNSLAIAEQKKKEKERIEKEGIEKAAIEKQRLEQARLEADKKRKEQEAIDRANDLMGSMGNSSSAGSGSTSGSTTQGNPAGSGVSGGNSWSLSGRSLSGRLVSPSYDNNVEGKITVNIRVDENGNVTSTSIGSPTNISDTETRNAAMAAARSTRFTSGRGVASGSITYNFKLR